MRRGVAKVQMNMVLTYACTHMHKHTHIHKYSQHVCQAEVCVALESSHVCSVCCLTMKNIFSLSRGAVQVRDTAQGDRREWQ